MTTSNILVFLGAIVLAACSNDGDTDDTIGQLGGDTDGGGSSGDGGGSGATAGAGGSSSGGSSAGAASGASGTSAGFFCGEETCGPDTTCCPATGRCLGANEGCVGIGCAVPVGAPADAGNCCADQGLAYCASNGTCHHRDCDGCCPPDVSCNDHPDCPSGMLCCYDTRQCYQPALSDCVGGPPSCADGEACPGNWVCCTEHGICHDPSCESCCPTDCAPQGVSCAGSAVPCCSGLQCCSGVPVPPGQEYCGTTCPISDRNAKHGITPVDPNSVLERVAALDIATWRYRDDAEGAVHMGPMAQDFHDAFGLGASDRCIATVDSDGVALAAIQALHRRLEKLERDNADLRGEVERLRADR